MNNSTTQVQGVVVGLTFHSSDTGYTITRLASPEMGVITVIFPVAVTKGQKLIVAGEWKNHPQYGQQFQAESWEEEKPNTLLGIERYLGDGQFAGIGPVAAKKIVDYFGEQTLEILENDVDRLIEVPGIGKKKVAEIKRVWLEKTAVRDIMVFLRGAGISPAYASKIIKRYGESAVERLTENPYQLTEIHGIGFRKADEIARNLGVPLDSPYRYEAGLLYALDSATNEGHCFLPQPELIKSATGILAVDSFSPGEDELNQSISRMVLGEKLVVEAVRGETLCYKPALHTCEKNLAAYLQMLLARPLGFDRTIPITPGLSDQQQAAVKMAATCRVGILTGGPGTGKTHTTKAIVELWQKQNKKIALACPTGRAAKRLTEMTGMEAKTIHRLLEFGDTGFKRNRDNQLNVDAVIIDEASMMDLPLAHALVRAIPLSAQLLLVGDSDQLPSVGPGRVLNDLIGSGQIPVVRLTEIFRQAQGSQITMNAHRINQGQRPALEPFSMQPNSDCLWIAEENPVKGAEVIRRLLELLPSNGYCSASNIQILCPGHSAEVGTKALNSSIQELLNPPSPEKPEITSLFGQVFRVGDRIMQTANDYERQVFNGDVGAVHSISIAGEKKTMVARFDDRLVEYEQIDLARLNLAYAISIHKSQGSEYPVVLLPLYTQHYMLLTKNLLYTALTRARQLAILIGQPKALGLAISRVEESKRHTLLMERLNGV